MIEDLEKSKQDLINQLAIDYAPIKEKWWKVSKPKYYPTLEIAYKCKNQNFPHSDVVIRNEKSNAVLPLLFLISILLTIRFVIKNEEALIAPLVFFIVFAIGLLILIFNSLSRKERLKITNDEIIFKTNRIKWPNIIASYIKEDITDEATNIDLVIHFINDNTNDFDKAECCLNNLELAKEDICFYLEYWKAKSKV